MSKPSAIIIGAGLGGLSTGTYAQMNGYQCQIFEHARHPGGVVAEWKRQGYTIDGGIHFYMGYRPGRPDHDLYRELGLYQEDQYLEMTNVATPHTWWRFTRNRQGAFEGFAIIDKIFTVSVKRTLPGLDNFFMAGQWVVPGGGVIPTLVSGKHAAMLLCRRDGKVFNTSSEDA